MYRKDNKDASTESLPVLGTPNRRTGTCRNRVREVTQTSFLPRHQDHREHGRGRNPGRLWVWEGGPVWVERSKGRRVIYWWFRPADHHDCRDTPGPDRRGGVGCPDSVEGQGTVPTSETSERTNGRERVPVKTSDHRNRVQTQGKRFPGGRKPDVGE